MSNRPIIAIAALYGAALAMLAMPHTLAAQPRLEQTPKQQAPTTQGAQQRITDLELDLAQQEQRIADLEALVLKLTERDLQPSSTTAPSLASPRADAPPLATISERQDVAITGLTFSGDLRLRYEQNWSSAEENRGRAAIRARIAGRYKIAPKLELGARLVTGNPDDPNSADVTLGGFNDDLTIAFDQAYARYSSGGFELTAGMIPQPFRRTDMVWDGDYNPHGASLAWKAPLGQDGSGSLQFKALYSVVDENVAGSDSDLWGAQADISFAPSQTLKLGMAISYFDYQLNSIGGADAGDFRGNLRDVSGEYASDFDLINTIAWARWSGLSEDWPVTLTGDFVHNLGAASNEDTGYSIAISTGTPSRWQVGYSFSQTDADAVFAAYSQDNIGISTDYLLHHVSLSRAVSENAKLELLYYRYRPQKSSWRLLSEIVWRNRLRMNAVFSF